MANGYSNIVCNSMICMYLSLQMWHKENGNPGDDIQYIDDVDPEFQE